MDAMKRHPLRRVIPGESWKSFFGIVGGVWFSVWVFAAIHNQYLIRIAPEHFTVWHYKMPFFQGLTALGIAYAFGASLSPGVVLGVALFVAGRLFDRPKCPGWQIILSTALVWIAVEVCALAFGFVAWRTGRGIYPEWVYPEDSPGMLITQTIQITAYLSGIFFSLLLIVRTWRRRKAPTAQSPASP